MNKKTSLLIIAVIAAMIIFTITVKIQKDMIDYVPTVSCLIINKDMNKFDAVSKLDVKAVDMPSEIVGSSEYISNIDEVEDLILTDNIYKGQILLKSEFDSKENMKIYDTSGDTEKISIKIKDAENGVSFILKQGSRVNVYATLNSEYLTSKNFDNFTKYYTGTNNEGYAVIKILSNVQVLDTFDQNGEDVKDLSEKNIDTILVSVTSEEAYLINLIRDVAYFNVSEL